ncbi:MAG: NADH-quinone oxidoreductase subunit C [Gammaproteobacteria bacterium]|nr:NADH-quinone oxidoreductase subunit C [Gammaproteobacteria bacterium]
MSQSRFTWLPKLLSRLAKSRLALSECPDAPRPALAYGVQAEDWGRLPVYLQEQGCRFAGLWAEVRDGRLAVLACVEKQGDYLVFETEVPIAKPELGSWSPVYPGANRLERHARDLLGLVFLNSPDARRWTRHQAWGEDEHPLRKDFPAEGHGSAPTPADAGYPFERVEGEAVYEIPVGPVHAGIIEPGHFRFHALGETVLNLEARLGYVHKGIEKLAEGRDGAGLLRLAARVSGDSAVAHAWAAAQALERTSGAEVPERGLMLRALLAERERIANHLGDIGAICNDVGFSFAHMQFGRLRELWLRRNAALFGHRLLFDTLVPGGVARNLDKDGVLALLADCRALRKEVTSLFPVLRDSQSLRDRLMGAGVLAKDQAQRLGCLGFVARASGIDYDLRRDHGYAPYERLSLEHPLHQAGDVAARVLQRAEEIYASLGAIRQLLDRLPHGPIAVSLKPPEPGTRGLGLVDGWRGEILSYVRFGEGGRVSRYFPRDPSWFNWPALEVLIHGNIVPDFPVCNKSINGSYAGVDL